ncbi:MAG: GDSL family lipase [Oscillospiraceae bacterium]|nr:GDSL family lipase [Oscillospiraceae bacterium]
MDRKIVLFQGDSITDSNRDRNSNGHGVGYAQRVAGVLRVNEPYKYMTYNRGISGNRVVDLYARMRKDIINLKPDYMSILIGVNDVWHELDEMNGVSAEKYERIYDMLIEEVLQELPGIRIMIMEPFVLPGYKTVSDEENPGRWEYFRAEIELRAAAARRIAQKYDLVFVPLQEMFDRVNADSPIDGYWLRDGVHPSMAGHELLAREWLKAFEKLR